jgi:sulfur carrier protein
MKATINGELREVPEGLTMQGLLAHIAAPEGGVAVAKNDRVVRRAAFAQETVQEGDRIEIIRAVAGG